MVVWFLRNLRIRFFNEHFRMISTLLLLFSLICLIHLVHVPMFNLLLFHLLLHFRWFFMAAVLHRRLTSVAVIVSKMVTSLIFKLEPLCVLKLVLHSQTKHKLALVSDGKGFRLTALHFRSVLLLSFVTLTYYFIALLFPFKLVRLRLLACQCRP